MDLLRSILAPRHNASKTASAFNVFVTAKTGSVAINAYYSAAKRNQEKGNRASPLPKSFKTFNPNASV